MSEQPSDPPKRSPHPLRDPLPEDPQSPQQEHPRTVRVEFPGTVQVPYVTYILLAINVGLFLLRYINIQAAASILDWGVARTENILVGRELYRLFTAMFLHLNEAHLLFNSIALYYIGSNVEYIFGHVRFLMIYLLGGLAGSVLMMFFSMGGLGASGAVFAIWGAEVVFFYLHRQLFGAIASARLRNSLLMMAMNFLIGFTANTVNSLTDSAMRISNAAHFGGLIGGALLTWLIGPRFTPSARPNMQPGELPFTIIQTNPLPERVRDILFYCSGLAALILLAILLRA